MFEITDTNTYTIPNFKMPEFMAAIVKLNRKAAKLGVTPVVVETIANIDVKHVREPEEGSVRGKVYYIPSTVIALFGKAPRVEGFEFIARVEYLSDGESTLFHTVPGADTKIDERFRILKSGTCEHCNKIRLRKDTFIVKELSTGQQKQVGRQCLADYTGIHTVENLAAKASWATQVAAVVDEIDEYWSGGARGYFVDKVDTLHALALTSAYIEKYGWTAKSACFDGSKTATASYVSCHFGPRSHLTSEEKQYLEQFDSLSQDPKHIERSTKVVAWIKDDLAIRAKSDYELNLVTLVTKDLTESKHLGIVCSAVSAYQRAMNQQVEYSKRAELNKNSKPVGEVGKRFRDLPVEVTFLKSLESNWGASTLVKFRDETGNILTWFASGDRDFEVGQKTKITATVKAHNEYNGIMETQVSRVV